MGSRMTQYAITALLVVVLNFFLPRLMPGDPLANLDSPDALPIPLSDDQRARIIAYYGLDKPPARQFADYIMGLARGDLGWSISCNAPVAQVLAVRLRWTLSLVGIATTLNVLLGIVLGTYSAWHRQQPIDSILLTGSAILGSFPAFFLGMMLVVLLGYRLGWFPLGGAISPTLAAATGWPRALDIAHHMALPVLALVLTGVSDIYYLTRNAMVQVLGEGYILAARAKGLSERTLRLRHALPNALLPIISLVAMRFGFIVMGAMMIEVTFAYPGMGSAIVEASVARDYPLLQGAFLVTMLAVLLANMVGDLAHRLLDPRVRTA
ncbi:MAG: ABC transporter permease [Anaerolineae bacterium]